MIAAPAIASPEPTSQDILAKAAQWAVECGLSEPFLLGGPTREDFPRMGHGYVVTISEQNSAARGRKTRIATARFTERGERRMWTIDGQVVL